MVKEVGQLPQDLTSLQERLLLWFESHQRDFPWRDTRNPYAILVAEKLLQQTAARESVVHAFREIMERYPTPEMMAQANPADLHTIIEPLGFHYRAQELRALANTLVAQYAGEVPTNLQDLMRLPGVGEYTARAVLTFAHGQDIPVVDTNVARLLYRLFGIDQPLPPNPARKRSILHLAALLTPSGRSREFNLAILDLCGEICTVHNPSCGTCPIQAHCAYGREKLSANE